MSEDEIKPTKEEYYMERVNALLEVLNLREFFEYIGDGDYYSVGVGGLLDLYQQEKEKNKELFEEYNKRVNTIIKYEQGIKCFVDETNITDIEPWSTYKINGGLLFNLNELLEEE